MATAVEASPESRTPSSPPSLGLASLAGAAYVLAALLAAFWLLPTTWGRSVAPHLAGNQILNGGLLLTAVTAAVLVLWQVGRLLAGENPPHGLRGGIFLMISWAVATFFLTKRVAFLAQGVAGGEAVTAAALALLLLLGWRFFSGAGARWSVALEDQGWFHATQYKRALGQTVRRLTILGLLLVGGTGVYSLMYHGLIPGTWAIAVPFADDGGLLAGVGPRVVVLRGANLLVPLVLVGLTLWAAWRVVNMPAFAEFLIATEAEMNKVSWTSKRRLAQDTVVVIVTTTIVTLFLLFVDFFWSWLLSRQVVGVLPKLPDGRDQNQVQQAKW